MKVGTLEIELLANMARLQADINAAKGAVTSGMNSINSAVGLAKSAFVGLIGAVSVGMFTTMIKQTIDAAGALNDLSIITGASVESLSGLAQVGALSGVSVETIASSMNKLAKNMSTATEDSIGAANALRSLNINVDDFKKLNADQQMKAVAKAMDEFANGTGKSAAAMALYGKTGAGLLPMMADLAAAGELHAVVTAEQAAQSDNFGDNLTRLQLSSAAFKTELVMGVLPALDQGLQAFIDVNNGAGGLRESIRQLAADGTLERWTKGGITGLSYVADAAQLVIRAIKMTGESIGAYAAAGVAYFGGIAQALKLVVSGDFAGAVAAMKSGMAQSKSVITDLGSSVISTFGEATFGSKVRARMTEIGALGETAKEAKKKLDFSDVVGKTAKTAKEAIPHVEQLLKTIQVQTAEFKAQTDATEPMTAGMRMYAKVTEELALNLHKLTPAEKARVVAALEVMRATERLMIQQEARMKMLHEEAALQHAATLTYETTVTALRDQTAALKEEVLMMGMSATEQRAVAQTRTDIILLTKQQELASIQAADAEAGTMSRRAIALEEEIRLMRERGELLTKKVEQETAMNNFRSVWQSIDSTAHDVFVNIFQGGQDVFKKLTNVLKSTLLDLLYQMTVKKWIFNIAASVTGTSSGLANAAVGGVMSGGGGGLGGIFSTLGSLSGGTGLLGAAGLGLQSGFGALMSGGLAGVGAAVEGGLAAIGTGMGSSIAAGLGTIAGALGPIALGIGVAYKLLSGKPDSRFGGTYGYNMGTGSTDYLHGPVRGSNGEQGVKDAITSTVGAINNVLSAVGSDSLLTGFHAGLETSNKGRGGVMAGGTLSNGASFGESGQGSNYNGTYYERNSTQSPDSAQAAKDFALDLKQSIVQALQASNGLPSALRRLVSGVDAEGLDDAAVTSLLAAIDAQVTGFKQFKAAMQSLPFENLKNLSFDAATGLMAAVGGLDALGNKLSSYMDNYYTDEEKRMRVISQINSATAGSGFNAATATRAQFRALLEAQDTTTTSGLAMYAALLNVADAFASITPAAEAVADNRQELISQYEAEASALQGTVDKFKDFAQSLRQFRDGLLTGSMSPLTPEQRYAEAGAQFDKIMRASQTGTQAEREAAYGQLQGAASTLLETSKFTNASGGAFITDFLRVQEALSSAAIGALATADVAQLQLDAANAQLAVLNSINTAVGGSSNLAPKTSDISATAFRIQAPSEALLAELQSLTEEVRGLRAQQSGETIEQINATYGASNLSATTIATNQSRTAWSQPTPIL